MRTRVGHLITAINRATDSVIATHGRARLTHAAKAGFDAVAKQPVGAIQVRQAAGARSRNRIAGQSGAGVRARLASGRRVAGLQAVAEQAVVAERVAGDVQTGRGDFAAGINRARHAVTAINRNSRLAATGQAHLNAIAKNAVGAVDVDRASYRGGNRDRVERAELVTAVVLESKGPIPIGGRRWQRGQIKRVRIGSVEVVPNRTSYLLPIGIRQLPLVLLDVREVHHVRPNEDVERVGWQKVMVIGGEIRILGEHETFAEESRIARGGRFVAGFVCGAGISGRDAAARRIALLKTVAENPVIRASGVVGRKDARAAHAGVIRTRDTVVAVQAAHAPDTGVCDLIAGRGPAWRRTGHAPQNRIARLRPIAELPVVARTVGGNVPAQAGSWIARVGRACDTVVAVDRCPRQTRTGQAGLHPIAGQPIVAVRACETVDASA